METNTKRNADILALVEAGVPYAKIGAAYGLTRARIQQIARRAGIYRTPQNRPYATYPEHEAAFLRAGALREQALKLADIADKYDRLGLELEAKFRLAQIRPDALDAKAEGFALVSEDVPS